jgi:hypothetical protein
MHWELQEKDKQIKKIGKNRKKDANYNVNGILKKCICGKAKCTFNKATFLIVDLQAINNQLLRKL